MNAFEVYNKLRLCYLAVSTARPVGHHLQALDSIPPR